MVTKRKMSTLAPVTAVTLEVKVTAGKKHRIRTQPCDSSDDAVDPEAMVMATVKPT